jgi:hypothetical protein
LQKLGHHLQKEDVMKSRFFRISAVVSGAVAGGLLFNIIRESTNLLLGDTTSPSSTQSSPIRDNEAGMAVRRFLAAMNRAGDDAQAAYEEALAALHERPEEVIAELTRAERMTSEDDYPTRWAFVYAAAQLRHPAALPFLRDLTLARIPPERSKDPHSFSTVVEETILRTTAVEGVEHLAVSGGSAALEVLFEFLEQPSLSVRRAAVQAIFATETGQSLRRRVANLLPEDQLFLLDVKRVDVREVSQIDDPQRHLVEAARRARTTPAPRLPDDAPGRGAAPSGGLGESDAPRIR